MDNELLEQKVYEKMCLRCPYAKECHDNCEHCDDFYEEYDKEEGRIRCFK